MRGVVIPPLSDIYLLKVRRSIQNVLHRYSNTVGEGSILIHPTALTLSRGILTLTALCLLLSCSGDGKGHGPDINPGMVTPPTVDPQDAAAASVFNQDSLYHFEVTVEDSLWTWLNTHVLDEEFVSANVKVGGKEWKNVGIRYKGAYGTLKLCFDGAGKLICDKLSMKIRFDEYEEKQKFHGLKRLNFHSLTRDPTKLHDRLASHLFHEMGIPAARSTHATLSVNGKNLGLFALVEQIDEEFAESRFPKSGKGNLYKEIWPQSTEPAPYLAALETNTKDGDPTPMTRFARDLKTITAENQKSLLGASVDVEYLLRYLAVDQVITNWDGATTFYCYGGACKPHNLFWYQDDLSGRLWLIPWDFDATFGTAPFFSGHPDWNDLEASCTPFKPSAGTSIMPAGCDPLLQTLARYYPEDYRKAVEAFLGGALDIPKLEGLIDRWADQIQPDLEKDPTRSQSLAQWKTEVRRLKETLPLLRRNAQRRLDKVPTVPFGLVLASVAGFEGWLPIEVEGVVQSYCNKNSQVSHSLNSASPLAGAQDYRLDFIYRNDSEDSSGAWKHYVTSGMPFVRGAATDLRGVRSIRFTAKADKPRIMRLDITSTRYTNPYSGVLFGWEVVVGSEAKEYTLELADLAIPTWGKAIPETVADILPVANGLQWSPFVVGRNPMTGLLEGGNEDAGFIQIDDIQFIP